MVGRHILGALTAQRADQPALIGKSSWP
jgi:hypothetical protein